MTSRAYFYVAPSEARGPSALTRLGMTKREACRGMTSRDAVPNEVRGASLSSAGQKRTLGRTKIGGSSTGPKRGGSAGQSRGGLL
jgi:hypothetical protein